MTDGISIHAPAKGATPKAVFVADAFDYFNPRSREGSDGMTMIFSNANTDFNPRSREGSDNLVILPLSLMCISIHAPAKGATLIS